MSPQSHRIGPARRPGGQLIIGKVALAQAQVQLSALLQAIQAGEDG